MYAYDKEKLLILFDSIISRSIGIEAWSSLKAQASLIDSGTSSNTFNVGFVAMPRRTGKSAIVFSKDEATLLTNIRPGVKFNDWTIDRLARVWWLLQLDSSKRDYVSRIENLFLNAEMNELIALYSALPCLAHPQEWRMRCAEGIRSNIAQVLEAIMCDNPYPSEQLDELAWNQLVLKAIFTDKPLLSIYGLRARANKELANSISAFAHERWAAHRSVNPLVWVCVADFIDEDILSDLKHLLQSVEGNEKIAGALACAESSNEAAKKLLQNFPEAARLLKYVSSWEALSERMLSHANID